ncbi:MAG: hypothetical protein AB1938_32375, partial [Myxococcota bacterium]
MNEFLQQLEAHRGAVICTTNLWHALDAAALRRFAFKVEFRYLTPAQAVTAFRAHFEELLGGAWDEARVDRLESGLGALPGLALGDFAAVSRRARMVGRAVDDGALIEELRREAGVRGTVGPLGFRQGGG